MTHRLLVGMLLVPTLRHLGAQPNADSRVSPARWHVTGELGGVLGSTWLSGGTNPTVTTAPGVVIGAMLLRDVSARGSIGVTSRVSAQPLNLRENGARWSGGTLSEFDLAAGATVLVAEAAAWNASLELNGGAALLNGARGIAPFRDIGVIVPLAEVGASVLRLAETRSRELTVFVRGSLLRLDASTTGVTSSGWVRRVSAGVRVSR